MNRVDNADEVDVEGIDEGLNRQFCSQWTDSGVGDHNIESAELFDRGRQSLFEADSVAHIDFRSDDDTATLGLHQLDRVCEVFFGGQFVSVRGDVGTQVEGDDVGAFLGQVHGVAAALAACRSTDECDFALSSFQLRSSYRL